MKTVRFSQLVARCGKPRVHTLWIAPDKDSEFRRAVRSDRVLTINHGGGKTDFGFVGFDARDSEAREFLIFPKSLSRFKGARVVGIKFELVSQPRQIRAARPTRPTMTATRRHRPGRGSHPAKIGAGREIKSSSRAPVEPMPPPQPRSRRRFAGQALAQDPKLRHAVQRALKELAAGKNVAAFQRLERALSAEGAKS